MDILQPQDKKRPPVFNEEKFEEFVRTLREVMWNLEAPSKAEMLK